MVDYEQLGVFYLGKKYDLDKRVLLEHDLVLYESRDLVTHAVCVGMTGSGKTGLCIDLLEEAAIDNIPVIAVDPKGDLANLLLTFDDLSARSFLPWIDPDEARRAQITVEEMAARVAGQWQAGLAAWQQDGSRIKKLKESAEFVVYTPASQAGTPLSVVQSFNCPEAEILEESDLLREQIAGTATGIMSLLGVSADPLKSKEHILLSAILESCWKAQQDLHLTGLIEKIQNPPIKQLGALPLETFFPAKERHEFALSINNLLASPGFAAWLEGEALDLDRLFYSESGKNKVSIISIAHLADSERMFFVSLLLTRLVAWMRRQSGTSSLRAIFYMDEILGFFPPVANPPSKAPLVTLLKQARAFGLGIVLATQNPVDLDYKALGNTGTWFIGRLQTERDKLKVLDGLAGAASDSGKSFNRAGIDRLISGLDRQVFFMNNVHQAEPTVFKTRWSLSYLRGPLSRAQLKSLKKTAQSPSAPAKTAAGQAASVDILASEVSKRPEIKATDKSAAVKSARPVLPPEIIERFAPLRADIPEGSKLVYKPMIFASACLRFTDAKSATDQTEPLNLLTLIKSETLPVKWERAFATRFGAEALRQAPEAGIEFAELPDEAVSAASYKQWSKDLNFHLSANRKLTLLVCQVSGQFSRPQESERDFRIRLKEAAREKRDSLVAGLSKKYSEKLAVAQEKLARAQDSLDHELSEARAMQMESAMDVGASIFQAFVGRKVLSARNIRQARSAARQVGRAGRQREEVSQAQETCEMLQEKISLIQSEFDREMAALKEKLDPASQTLATYDIALKKSNISLTLFCLCWAPCIRQSDGKITAAW
jgi:hypothetical protein